MFSFAPLLPICSLQAKALQEIGARKGSFPLPEDQHQHAALHAVANYHQQQQSQQQQQQQEQQQAHEKGSGEHEMNDTLAASAPGSAVASARGGAAESVSTGVDTDNGSSEVASLT